MIFKKNNTDPIPHLHPCSDTRIRRKCGSKIGFYQGGRNFICLFIFMKTHFLIQIDNRS